MEATKLRKKTDELESKIETLLVDFIKTVGNCDIDITPELTYHKPMVGEKTLVNIKLKVHVTV